MNKRRAMTMRNGILRTRREDDPHILTYNKKPIALHDGHMYIPLDEFTFDGEYVCSETWSSVPHGRWRRFPISMFLREMAISQINKMLEGEDL